MIGVPQTFLLSPADCGGPRAKRLLRRLKEDPVARPSLGDGFREISALYFRGKLDYARRFANPRPGQVPVWVITPSRGIRPVTDALDAKALGEFGAARIAENHQPYRQALDASLADLCDVLTDRDRVVFLGSLATRKYIDALGVLGRRVVAPHAFDGLGNMQRGSMLLRCVREGTEMAYRPLAEFAPTIPGAGETRVNQGRE